ncbi:MAG: Ig-like domain-containing protein [Ruminococcus sp.]|nr:Ig-like domain-containing protein [Ruminococcus sp.]
MAYDQNSPQRPRKRVTRQVLRRRQFTALAIIALIVLVFVILIAHGCSKDDSKGSKKTDTPAVTTTVPTEEPVYTDAPTEAPTEAVTTVDPAAAQVQLSKREVFVDIGQRDVAIIQAYPDGSSEANEIWESKDPTIASVDNLGYITGVSAGETYVILKFSNNPGIEIEIKVHVADNGLTAAPADSSTDTTTTAASGLL